MKTKHGFSKKSNERSPLKKPLRQSGQSDAQMVRSLEFQIALFIGIGLLFFFLTFYEWLVWYFHSPPQPFIWSCLTLIVIAYCYYKIRSLLAEKRNWELGRQGEIEVGNCLEELRAKGYDIFHDIQCNAEGRLFNIDHVIVSPHGIFAIETKTPRKRLLRNNRVDFDGQSTIEISRHTRDKETVPSALSKARWLSNNILPKRGDQKKYHVLPVIVYPGWSVNGKLLGRDAWVLNPRLLQWEIPRQPRSLTQEECNSVSQVSRERNR